MPNKDALQIDEEIAKMAIQKNILLEQMLRSNDPNEIYKAQNYLQKQQKVKSSEVKAFLFDPYDTYYQTGGVKQQRKRVSFDILKKVSDTPIVNSVINTRVFQIQNFLRFVDDETQEGFTVRKKRNLFDKKAKTPTTEEKKKIEYIVNFLENGGLRGKWDLSDDLGEFTRKTMRDSLSLDQLSAECERNRRYELIGFQAIDASTIRILETVDPRFKEEAKQKYEERFGYLPRYAQVFQGNIMINPLTNQEILYYPWELMYAQRNKSSHIEKNGYGTSEVEVLLDIITWSMWGMQYNGNFFKQGSNPKGFINIKEDGVNTDIVNDFRQTWRQMIAGVNNCVDGDTNIISTDGYNKIGELFLNDKDDKFLRIWDGEEFVDGRVYISGKKKLCSTLLNNGIELKTSSNHRIMAIDENSGYPIWKEQKDIKLGDFVLVNKNSVISEQPLLSFRGKEVESDLFEFLGWAIGDGHFGSDKPKDRHMSTFYHSVKEPWILERHSEILSKYGINHKTYEKFYTEKEKEYSKKRYGFKTIADSSLSLTVFDSEFMKFVFSLGFKSSKEGKQIPKFLYSYNSGCKQAFLKGLFSADGTTNGGKYVFITITKDSLREEIKQLLLTEGIRCSNFEGRANFSSNNFGITPKDGYQLGIKDNKEFFDKIGMLQPHKQFHETSCKSSYVQSVTPKSTGIMVMKHIRKYCKENKIDLDKSEKRFITDVICGDNSTMSSILNLAKTHNIPLPEFATNYNFAKVIGLTEFDEEVEMYDVEMFNEKHQFIANGVLTHNSHKIPIFSGVDLEWIDLQGKNTDMEFHQWMEFLIIMLCSVFTIDPSELGYQFQGQANIFGQDGQKERLQHSKKKGLKPLLLFFEKVVTKWIVSEIDAEYEFAFTGIDSEDEAFAADLDAKKLSSGAVSFESVFEKNMGRPYNEKTDTILNPVFLQMMQMKQFGGEGSNGAVDEMAGGEDQGAKNPFEDFDVQKSVDSNPIVNDAMRYINDQLNFVE